MAHDIILLIQAGFDKYKWQLEVCLILKYLRCGVNYVVVPV